MIDVKHIVRRMRLDITPLRRHRDYRLLVGSATISLFGSFVTLVAAPLQIKELTNSYLAVGLVGAAEFLPLVVFGLWGGAIADAIDRRRTVILTEFLALLCSAALMVNALLSHPRLWVIYIVAAIAAGATAVQRPSIDAIMARVVPLPDQSAAAALTGLQHNGGAILGPALGGLLAAWSLPAAYGVDVASFVLSLLLLVRLAPISIPAAGEPVSLASIAAGLRYAASRKDLLGTYLVDLVAMAFAMPQALYPFLADQLHHPHALGALYSAGGVGAVLATLASGWTSRVHRHGLMIVLAAAGWGLGMALAGIAPNVWLILICLAFAGGADMYSGIFRDVIWNQTIPDELRGRLAGIELLAYGGGPTLGNARAGVVARFSSVRFAIGAGGLACLAGVAAIAALLPQFLRYDGRTNVHAVSERERRAAATPLPGADG
jgi:MFS family permease